MLMKKYTHKRKMKRAVCKGTSEQSNNAAINYRNNFLLQYQTKTSRLNILLPLMWLIMIVLGCLIINSIRQ